MPYFRNWKRILICLTSCVSLFMISACSSDSRLTSVRFVEALSAGETQTIVGYGTSLTAALSSTWFQELSNNLENIYPGQTDMINSAFPAVNSEYGVQFILEKVVAQDPDTVFIEFAINDAKLEYNISIEQSRLNLEYMLDEIQLGAPDCEVILLTMNPPVGEELRQRPQYYKYYQMYRDVAKERKTLIVDLQSNWEDILQYRPEVFFSYLEDEIHPNAEGTAEVIIPELYRALGIQQWIIGIDEEDSETVEGQSGFSRRRLIADNASIVAQNRRKSKGGICNQLTSQAATGAS